MQFISLYFMIFMLMVLAGYYVIPGRFRHVFLLICNLFYYVSCLRDIRYLLAVTGITIATWLGAKIIDRCSLPQIRRMIVLFMVILCVGSLICFKYAAFLMDNLNRLAAWCNIPLSHFRLNVLMPLGLGKMLGLRVTENFKAPYFSKSIQEFWRRWHISLSTWFRDYVYIPLGGSRCPTWRKNCNLMITFLVSGIWHGANSTFIIWGMLHGLYQIMGTLTSNIRRKLYEYAHVKTNCFSFRLGQRAGTFLFVAFAWIFFRAETVKAAFLYILRMFSMFDIWKLFDGTIYELGLNTLQMDILGFALLIMFFVDYVKYKKDKNIDVILLEQNLLFRAAVLLLLFFMSFVFGMYGPAYDAQEFIYFQF